MTTSETYGGYPPPPPEAAPRSARQLRRSNGNRVAAGVAGGMGEYFGVDPVLFRVLFATSAFFGGAGILAYLLAWAAVPDAGTEHAVIDGWVAALRRRRVPAVLVAVVAAVVFWLAAFSWWAPGPFLPVLVVVVLLAVFYGRHEIRESRRSPVAPTPGSAPADSSDGGPAAAATVSLDKPGAPDAAPDRPNWVSDARSWVQESREASRLRRRRAFPVRIAMLIALVVALTTLGIADAVSGIQLQVYFWTALAILVFGLLAGLALRRFPASLTALLVPTVIGTVAFAGSHASLSDGIGQRQWKPTDSVASSYRLAFGQGVLDLSALPTPLTPQTVHVTVGAGQVKIIAPPTLNLTVLANIHFGQLEVDGLASSQHGGVGLSRTVSPPAAATGAPITVDVHLAEGAIDVEHS